MQIADHLQEHLQDVEMQQCGCCMCKTFMDVSRFFFYQFLGALAIEMVVPFDFSAS